MASYSRRHVDKFKWLPHSLLLTAADKTNGLNLMMPRYTIGIGPISMDSQLYKDYEANKANTEFEVNTFLAEMISQAKG